MNRITYWLYYGNRIVASVRSVVGQREEAIRMIALHRHERLPLMTDDGFAPFEWAIMIAHSTVRVYPDGR